MKSIKYNKLVRDKIPEIIGKDGKKAKIEKAKGEKLISLLNKKLDEELEEYKESGNIEELADLVEVVYGIVEHQGFTIEDLEHIRKDKKEARGAFKDGIVLLEVKEGD